MSGWVLAGFEECAVLGEGAQGRVVLAQHTESGKFVAIKYLATDTGRALDRFRDEAHLLMRVRDPHVAQLLDYLEGPAGQAAIIMETVDGVSLKKVLSESGPLAAEVALSVLKGSLAGLAAAHACGVIHRDYKPANVVVRGDGLSKLIDFGVAGLAGSGSGSGTPMYMAPEQWRSDPSSPATDIYAATCVFYECITGRPPFAGRSVMELREQHTSGEIPVGDVPAPLRPLLLGGMAKDPAERPPDAPSFMAELETAAVEAYGSDWESRAAVGLAAATVALVASFPSRWHPRPFPARCSRPP